MPLHLWTLYDSIRSANDVVHSRQHGLNEQSLQPPCHPSVASALRSRSGARRLPEGRGCAGQRRRAASGSSAGSSLTGLPATTAGRGRLSPPPAAALASCSPGQRRLTREHVRSSLATTGHGRPFGVGACRISSDRVCLPYLKPQVRPSRVQSDHSDQEPTTQSTERSTSKRN